MRIRQSYTFFKTIRNQADRLLGVQQLVSPRHGAEPKVIVEQPRIFGTLDSPVDSQVANSVVHIHGWELHTDIRPPRIEITIDKQPVEAHISRIIRPDVVQVYPELAATNPYAGFEAVIDIRRYTDGNHLLTCIAHNANQSSVIGCVNIQVQNSWLPYQEVLSAAGESGRVLHRKDIYGSGPPSTSANPETLSLIMQYCQAPLLDLGCGIAPFVAALEKLGIATYGLEINPDYVAQATALQRKVQLYDGTTIPFADGSFDTVMAIEVLEHIPDWDRTLEEMLRVARRCVLLSVPNIGVIPSISVHMVVPWHILEATHVNFFTAEILTSYLRKLPGITTEIYPYGAFQINAQSYHNHLFVVIHKIHPG